MKEILTALFLLVFTIPVYADGVPEKNWGIAVGLRHAKISYKAKDESGQDFIPLMAVCSRSLVQRPIHR